MSPQMFKSISKELIHLSDIVSFWLPGCVREFKVDLKDHHHICLWCDTVKSGKGAHEAVPQHLSSVSPAFFIFVITSSKLMLLTGSHCSLTCSVRTLMEFDPFSGLRSRDFSHFCRAFPEDVMFGHKFVQLVPTRSKLSHDDSTRSNQSPL